MSAQILYEEFRQNYEYDAGEEPLKPWALLTNAEKLSWEDQWRRYSGVSDGDHGDPAITERNKPRG